MKSITELQESFYRNFAVEPQDIFSSSGRIELLGNHTDHNHGRVLVSAINRFTFAVTTKKAQEVNIISAGYPKMKIQIDDLAIREEEKGTSPALIRGILFYFQKFGYQIGGFNAVIDTNIDCGVGLSSSAAFELLIAQILNYYYNQKAIDSLTLARICQMAEGEYFGKPCGLLDQIGIAFGKANYIDFLHIDNPIIKSFDFVLKDYRLILVNTGGSHDHLTKHYTQIREDMHKVSAYFNRDVLREVSYEEFQNELPILRKVVGGRAILRALHFFEENIRVQKGYEALLRQDEKSFLQAVNDSGESSYKYLQNCYLPDDEEQGISLGLAISKKIIQRGAVRVHGGGFAGTILAFIHNEEKDDYIRQMEKVFGAKSVFEVQLEINDVRRESLQNSNLYTMMNSENK